MKRYLDEHVVADLSRKIVVLTGPRQVGKTTLARQLMASHPEAQYLNWDKNSIQLCECDQGFFGADCSLCKL